MNMNSESQIIRTEYSDLMKKSYIDYAMSVIIARAGSSRYSGVRSMICMNWGYAMISRTENVPVL